MATAPPDGGEAADPDEPNIEDEFPSLANFLGDDELAELPPQVVSQRIGSLARTDLEDLAQQLFLVLKRSEGRIMELRHEAALARGHANGRHAALQGDDQQPGLRRKRSNETLPRGGAQTARPSGARGRTGPTVGGAADSMPLESASVGARSPRQGPPSEDATQAVFDRLYNSAREQRVRRMVHSELGMMASEVRGGGGYR
mmetsp:Transcript_87015/g.243978  ORF Transcript_87015/g.243978 Transcript_87015/m.243978 type:complete len:201 (-) Transcript_87015:181-783(-)